MIKRSNHPSRCRLAVRPTETESATCSEILIPSQDSKLRKSNLPPIRSSYLTRKAGKLAGSSDQLSASRFQWRASPAAPADRISGRGGLKGCPSAADHHP